MPTYTFKHRETEEMTEVFLTMRELDEYKEAHPELQQILFTSGMIYGQSYSGGKLPEGFKDTLREMKKKHPHATGINQV